MRFRLINTAIFCLLLFILPSHTDGRTNKLQHVKDSQKEEEMENRGETNVSRRKVRGSFHGSEMRHSIRFDGTNELFEYEPEFLDFGNKFKKAYSLTTEAVDGAVNVLIWDNPNRLDLSSWIANFQSARWNNVEIETTLLSSGEEVAIVQECAQPHAIYLYVNDFKVISRVEIRGILTENWHEKIGEELGWKLREIKNYAQVVTTEQCSSSPAFSDGVGGTGSCSLQDASKNTCCSQYGALSNISLQCSVTSSGEGRGNCVWWAARQRTDLGLGLEGFRGDRDAGRWDNHASELNYSVNDCPRKSSIYVRESGGGYSVGHVAYVTEVNGSNTEVGMSEMNFCDGCLRDRSGVSASGSSAVSFIHTNQKEVQFYWDPGKDSTDRMVSDYKNPGLCGGREAPHYPGAGHYAQPIQDMPDWFEDQASAVKVPEGWSVRVWRDKDRQGPSLCLNESLNQMNNSTFEGTATKLDDNISSFQVFTEPNCSAPCAPPASGDWVVTQSCEYTGNAKAPASVIVRDNAVLTIAPTATLDIDLASHRIQVQNEAGILIKDGGKIY